MSTIVFADAALQFLSFSKSIPGEALILELIDTRWMQRLRDITQTGNTHLVYMSSEHSRFGHSLGVAYLASTLMRHLAQLNREKVEKYHTAVCAAALMHDIGHMAPGSHTAYKAWFPEGEDAHEEVSVKVITEDPEISAILRKYDPELPDLVAKILCEDASLPPWTWEIISGGGWNVDRGNWCLVDSIMAGVSYGRYNVPALIESIVLTNDNHLAVGETRLDALTHFAVARHAMYRQVYQHRVILATDTLNKSIVKRLRALSTAVGFADATMQKMLATKSVHDLELRDVFHMNESWWRYHLARWADDKDCILSDLANRLLFRRLLKTVRITKNENILVLKEKAQEVVRRLGYDPEYYLDQVSSVDFHAGDSKRSLLVQMDDGTVQMLHQAEPLIDAMLSESKSYLKSWLVMPKEAKEALGKSR